MCSGGSPAISASRAARADRAHGRRALAPGSAYPLPARPDRRGSRRTPAGARPCPPVPAAPPPRRTGARPPTARRVRCGPPRACGARRAPGCARAAALAAPARRRRRILADRGGLAQHDALQALGCGVYGRRGLILRMAFMMSPARRRPVPRCRARRGAGRPRPPASPCSWDERRRWWPRRFHARRRCGCRGCGACRGCRSTARRRLRRSNGLQAMARHFPQRRAQPRQQLARRSVSPL